MQLNPVTKGNMTMHEDMSQYGDILIDIVMEFAKFTNYSDDVSRYMTVMCLSLAFSSLMFLIMLGMKTHDRAVARKYKLDVDPDEGLEFEYEYAPNGLLKMYDGKCVITSKGANISGVMGNILSITCNEDAKNRIISIVYEDGSQTKIENIHCGNMDIKSYERLRRYMLQYAGG